jgi:hypothetical protein
MGARAAILAERTTLAPSRFRANPPRNLAVCVFGSFTTLVAMTLLLPFLPLYVEELGVKDWASSGASSPGAAPPSRVIASVLPRAADGRARRDLG